MVRDGEGEGVMLSEGALEGNGCPSGPKPGVADGEGVGRARKHSLEGSWTGQAATQYLMRLMQQTVYRGAVVTACSAASM